MPDAVNEALESAIYPSDGSSSVRMRCCVVGPCASECLACPGHHILPLPAVPRAQDLLVALRAAMAVKLPDLTELAALLRDVTLAQSYFILKQWAATFRGRGHCLSADLRVSPLVWTGDVVLVLLTSQEWI